MNPFRSPRQRFLPKGSTAMTFYEWLSRQVGRRDDVGDCARYAVSDRAFPRDAKKLGVFLLRYDGNLHQRSLIKLAHREWRQLRMFTPKGGRPRDQRSVRFTDDKAGEQVA